MSLLGNPSIAWLLINSAQIINFLPLSKLFFTPASVKFCKALGDFNLIPNLPELFLNPNYIEKPSDSAISIGIDTSDLWIYIGFEVTLIFGILVMHPILVFFKIFKISIISAELKNRLSDYK